MFDRRLLANFDWILFLNLIAICLLGVMAIYSASRGYPGENSYWLRQLYWVGLGLLVGLGVLMVDFRTIGQWSYTLHGLVIASLAALLVLDTGSGGVNRWFSLGPVAVQPSEFVKMTTVLALAYYFRDSRRVGNLGLRGLIWPSLIVLVPFFLIVEQPDLGTALLLIMIFIPMIILAGLRVRLLITMAASGVLAIGALIAAFQLGYYQVDDALIAKLNERGAEARFIQEVTGLHGQRFYFSGSLSDELSDSLVLEENTRLRTFILKAAFRPYISHVLRPYQQRRLVTFINPDYDPLGAGYHVIQSKIAVGSGGFAGKGFGKSTQGSLNFLPARHTDFIFSIFAEEWGFLGAVGVLGLYLVLIFRGLGIVFQTHDRFGAFATFGVLTIVTFQLLINTGMAMGLLPVVGVPLPFFSYGGSSMIAMMGGIALLLNIRMRRFLWG